MRLAELLLQETSTSLRRLVIMAAIAGGSNTAALAVINRAVAHLKDGRPQLDAVVIFLFVALAFLYSQRYVLLTTSAEVERLVHRYRERLLGKLEMCELREVERIGRGRLFAALISDTQTISQTASSLVMGAQSAILILCASVYIATISMTSLICAALFLTVAARIYMRKMQSVSSLLQSAAEKENELHDLVNGLLDGFKEVKLFSQRAEALLLDLVAVSRRTAAFRTSAQQAMGANFMWAQMSFLFLLGTLVFLTPMFGAQYSSTVGESMTTVIFLIGPISALVATVPLVAVANAAAENLYSLEQLLERNLQRDDSRSATPLRAPLSQNFQKLDLRSVFFAHDGNDEQFTVGPIDLTIRAGEIVFITGGNGSGKSTLIKLLTGLYPPLSGEIFINDQPVTPQTAQVFRDRFCAVFSDFHLFKRFYGLTIEDESAAAHWLETMEIADKTAIAEGGFTNIDLSAGQRKRLALISAILEEKSIVVLDEWAADQDPHFRLKFYEELLPRLRAEGKTIIAVTHDDRYFHTADRRLHMDEGRLCEITENRSNG